MTMTCPKCGFSSPDHENCTKCGINFAGYRRFVEHNVPSSVMGQSLELLKDLATVFVKQHEDALRIVTGWQTRNNYTIEDGAGQVLGWIGERADGVMGFFGRQFLRNRRPLNIDIFDAAGKHVAQIHRPYFWFFSDLFLYAPGENKNSESARQIGRVERKFSFWMPKYNLYETGGRFFGSLRCPLMGAKTLGGAFLGDRSYIVFNSREVETAASIMRSWNGVKGLFTDEDTYCVQLGTEFSSSQKLVILAAAISIDFDSYEKDKNLVGPIASLLGGAVGSSNSSGWSADQD